MVPGHILTGPVAIEGAEPGDVLEVEILDVRLRQDWGYNLIRPLAGTLPDDFHEARLINIPLYALLGWSVYALSRELGARKTTSLLMAALVLSIQDVSLPALQDTKPDTFMLGDALYDTHFVALEKDPRASSIFEHIATYEQPHVTLRGVGEPTRLAATGATADFFATLGAHAALGRVFTSADGALSRGLFYRPGGRQPRVGVHLMHPRTDQSLNYNIPPLVRAGYAVIGRAGRAVSARNGPGSTRTRSQSSTG